MTGQNGVPRPAAGTAIARVSEFGPLDLLAEWAHQQYLGGRPEDAVRSCRHGLVVAQVLGDRCTVRYLRYIEGVALQELGRHREAVTVALDLLADLEGDVSGGQDPWWRAKALALLAESSAGVGELGRAMDALAEGASLVDGAPTLEYNHLSARMAVALALSSVYLYEQADELIIGIDSGGDPEIDLHVLQEAALLRATWGASLTLVGRDDEAAAHFVCCAERALRMRRIAEGLGSAEMQARATVMEGFAAARLGDPELGAARVRGALGGGELRHELVESHLVHLVLGQALADRGDFTAAREHLSQAAADAFRARRDVWSGTALRASADADVAERGGHPAVTAWKRLAREALERMWGEREARFAALQDRNRLRELSAERDRMGRVVLEDPLTGLGNRRMLVDSVTRATEQISVVFVDVDRFKDVNDRFSHEVGDDVLRRLALILRTQCRADDVVIRYGGDEFVVLVSGDAAAADGIAHRLHDAVRRTPWQQLAPGLDLTVSVGVARSVTASVALATADAALYAAKRAGRDRVVSA